MGRAIGFEIKTCLLWKQEKDELSGKLQYDNRCDKTSDEPANNLNDSGSSKDGKAKNSRNRVKNKEKKDSEHEEMQAGGSSSSST